jgi:GTPase SAR1 family protein
MEQTKKNYQKFQEQRKQAEDLLGKGKQIFSTLNMHNEEAKAANLEEKVRRETFKVMVLGRFKTGKSTFINALLGEEVLPAAAVPCTAVINEIKYGETRKATLYFKDPLPEKMPKGISEKTSRYIRDNGDKTPPPLEVAVTDLREFVAIPDPGEEQAENGAETPYLRAELCWNLDLCKDGIEIIDSPGLDENATRTRIAVDYLSNADAILFVMTCLSLCSAMEMEFVDEKIRELGHEYLFFINNRINQIREKERDGVIKFGNARLASRTAFGTKGIFYINALGALDGRLNKDQKQVTDSGILPLEELLADFLVNKKGKIKILQPVQEYLLAIRKALFESIPMQKGLLEANLEEIKKRYEEQKPKLENLEGQKKSIIREIEIRIDRAGFDITRELENNIRYMSEQVPGWVEAIEPEKKISTLHPRESGKAVIAEILGKLQTRMETEQAKWVREKLTPLLETKMKEVFADREEEIKQFYVDLDEVKVRLSGVSPETAGVKDPTKGERIGAALVGLFIDAGSAWYGYNFGFSTGLYKQMAIQLGAIITMLLVGITNPITMLPVMFAIAIAGIFMGKGRIVQELKKMIALKVGEEMDRTKSATIANAVAGITSRMNDSSATIHETLQREINSVRAQVEQILRDKEAGEQANNEKKAQIARCETELKRIDQELNDLVMAVSMG